MSNMQVLATSFSTHVRQQAASSLKRKAAEDHTGSPFHRPVPKVSSSDCIIPAAADRCPCHRINWSRLQKSWRCGAVRPLQAWPSWYTCSCSCQLSPHVEGMKHWQPININRGHPMYLKRAMVQSAGTWYVYSSRERSVLTDHQGFFHISTA